MPSTSVTLQPPAALLSSHGADIQRQLLLFVTVIIAASVFLQRFGLPAGGKAINLVGPIGIGFAAWGLFRGTLVFNGARLTTFLVLCMLAMLGMAYHQVAPNRFLVAPSLQSVIQFLVLSSFATLSFAQPLPEHLFARRVTAIFGVVAIAGITQFIVQLAGVQLFSFRGIIPAALLFEDGYNLQIPVGVGNLFKSNGFFMLEPSVFSQFMAIALVLEIVTTKRVRFLSLFAGGLLLSMAGTGWIVLASFVVSVAFSMGRRGIVVSVATLVMVGVLGVGASLLAPDFIAAFTARLDEVSRPATSGHLRFVTPFWLLDDVMRQEPLAVLLGIGGGVSERLTLPYDYVVNTPVKIALEFGIPALLAYLVLLTVGRKTAMQRAVLVPGTVMLLFAGGYQQLAPVLFPILLIMSVANLEREPAATSS